MIGNVQAGLVGGWFSNHEADDASGKKGVGNWILRNQPACPPSVDGRLDSGQSVKTRESAKIVTIEIIHRQEKNDAKGSIAIRSTSFFRSRLGLTVSETLFE